MHRLDAYTAHRGREPPGLSNDLSYEREPIGVDPTPRRIAGRARQRSGDLRRANDVADRRRVDRREAAHVLRHAPQLLPSEEFLIEQVAEGRHRCAVEAGAQAVIDVFDGAATVEAPVLRQVGGKNRPPRVVFQGRGRWPVAAAQVTVALATPNRIVELSTHAQGFGAGPAA